MSDRETRLTGFECKVKRLTARLDALGTTAIHNCRGVVESPRVTNLSVIDDERNIRISTGSFSNGDVGVAWFDHDNNLRIQAGTNPNGDAAVVWADRDGKPRIIAGTIANGLVALPNLDLRDAQ